MQEKRRSIRRTIRGMIPAILFLASAVRPPVLTSAAITIPLVYEDRIPGNSENIARRGHELILGKTGVDVTIVPILNNVNGDRRREAEISILESSNADFDIVNVFARDTECMDLTELLQTYGGDVVELFLEQGQDLFDGRDLTYLPSLSDCAGCYGIAMRKDIVDKYGIDIEKLKTMEDFDRLYEKVSAAEPDLDMICDFRTRHGLFYPDNMNMFEGTVFCLSSDDPGEIRLIYEEKAYVDEVRLIRSWFEKGYIPDYISLQDISASELVRAGLLFSYQGIYRPCMESEASFLCGKPMVAVPITTPCVTSQTLKKSGWGISASCREPEEAMKVLCLFYVDEDIERLFANGIEGENYRYSEEGEIVPVGADASESGFHLNDAAGMLPNQYLTGICRGEDPRRWEKLKEFNKSAVTSPNLGFVFDDTAVKEENEALNTIAREYNFGLESGQIDPEIYLPEIMDEMEEAGAEKVKAELTRQYRAWVVDRD